MNIIFAFTISAAIIYILQSINPTLGIIAAAILSVGAYGIAEYLD